MISVSAGSSTPGILMSFMIGELSSIDWKTYAGISPALVQKGGRI